MCVVASVYCICVCGIALQQKLMEGRERRREGERIAHPSPLPFLLFACTCIYHTPFAFTICPLPLPFAIFALFICERALPGRLGVPAFIHRRAGPVGCLYTSAPSFTSTCLLRLLYTYTFCHATMPASFRMPCSLRRLPLRYGRAFFRYTTPSPACLVNLPGDSSDITACLLLLPLYACTLPPPTHPLQHGCTPHAATSCRARLRLLLTFFVFFIRCRATYITRCTALVPFLYAAACHAGYSTDGDMWTGRFSFC